MGLIVSQVTEKVRDYAPDTSSAWSDTYVRKMVHLADLAIREEAETRWTREEISLQSGTLYYSLGNPAIAVRSVEFSLDGSDYNYVLWPISYDELDRLDYRWADDTGVRPSRYLLLSAPGAEGYSRIMIWRPVASVTNETLRVIYTSCYPQNNLSFVQAAAPEWVQDAVYVPYTLGLLYAASDPQRAAAYMQEYQDGLSAVRERYRDEYPEGYDIAEAGGAV